MIIGTTAIRRLWEAVHFGLHPEAIFFLGDPGGAMRAAYTAGVNLFLDKTDLIPRVDLTVALSAGLPNVGYAHARQAELGVTIYHHITEGFLRTQRKPPFVSMDLERLRWCFSESNVKLDFEKLRTNSQTVLGGVTCLKTGKLHLLNPFQMERPVEVFLTSAALPYVTNPFVLNIPNVGETVCGDGGITGLTPYRKAVKIFGKQPTDYIILRNHPFNGSGTIGTFVDYLLSASLISKSTALGFSALSSFKRDEIALNELMSMTEANVTIIYPDTDVLGRMFTFDPKKIIKLVRMGFAAIPEALELPIRFPDIDWEAPFKNRAD